MSLSRPLERLSPRFDTAPLADELGHFKVHDWIPSPNSGLGNSSIPLIAVAGTANHDYALAGPMRATAALDRLPRWKELIAALGVSASRSRLVRLDARSEVPKTADWNYHWFRRSPLCIPIVTSPEVVFESDDSTAHLAAGEVWRFDPSKRHRLRNSSEIPCVHLIVETRDPLPHPGDAAPSLKLEPYQFEVLTYEEMVSLTEEILAAPTKQTMSEADRIAFMGKIEGIRHRWKAAFAQFGHQSSGELAYDDIILDFRTQILPNVNPTGAANQAAMVIDTMLRTSPPEPRKLHRPTTTKKAPTESTTLPVFDRPIIIVAAPRSGSTLLFDLLARFVNVWTIGGESHACIRGIPELHPAHKGYESDHLTTDEATPSIVGSLVRSFSERLVDRDGRNFIEMPVKDRPRQVRFVEKTPANALRIPFLRAVFPDALFIHLERDPKENISSLVEGWRSRRFLAYRDMPGWPYRDWSFLLPSGWQSLAGRSLVEIAAFQWHAAQETIHMELGKLPASSWHKVHYADLIRTPRDVLGAIATFAGLDWDPQIEHTLASALPVSRVTVSAPSSTKWLRHEAEITQALAQLR